MDKKEVSQFLVVRLADEQYAINLEHTIEIIPPRKMSPVSDTIQPLPKHFEYEDGLIPIIDLWRPLKNRERASLTDTILVITEWGGEKAALLVDSADEILRIDGKDSAEIRFVSDGTKNDLIEARLNTDDRNLPVINISGIYRLSGVII